MCNCKEVNPKEIIHTLLDIALDSKDLRSSKKAKEYLIDILSKQCIQF